MATETAVDVVMPQMGVSVSEGTITKWLKSEGETVEADEGLLEISTDKVDTEVPSPASGTVRQILAQEGETVAVGTKIAVIAPEGAPAEAPAAAPPEPATAQAAEEASVAAGAEGETPTAEKVEAEPEAAAPTQAGAAEPEPAPTAEPVAETEAPPEAEVPAPEPEPEPEPQPAPEPEPTPEPVAAAVPEAAPAEEGDGRREAKFVSPVVARIASEHGVDISQIEGTGRGGRVTKKDILSHIEAGAPAPAAKEAVPREAPEPAPVAAAPSAPAPATAAPKTAPAAPAPAPAPAAAGEQIEPMTAMRKGIAEHMRRSIDTSAHVTTTFEVDLSRVVAIREKLKREYEERHGVKLTYLSFIARATIDAIDKWPWMNAELRGESIVVKNYVNLGIAVALEGGKGLIVPVVKNADSLNLAGLAKAIADVAARTRDNKIGPNELSGSTITVTNTGSRGVIWDTPIINQPNAAIFATPAIVKRPVVVEDPELGEVVAVRHVMQAVLTYDHRIIDGADAARFLVKIKEVLEEADFEGDLGLPKGE